MEHKIIEGGEQYLPFARSRIKALKATGLKYASQQFEIDGCSVKVRIEPGHEYVHLSGGYTIWVLVNIAVTEVSDVQDPTHSSVTTTSSKLFRLGPDPTSAKAAKLIHSGETTRSVGYFPNSAGVVAYSASNTYGAITGFAVRNRHAVMWADTYVTELIEPSHMFFAVNQHWTRVVKWGANEKVYAHSVTGVGSAVAYSGEKAESDPVFLGGARASFGVRIFYGHQGESQLVSPYTIGFDSQPGPSFDYDYLPPKPLSESNTKFSRKEAGIQTQWSNRIYWHDYANGNYRGIYTRKMELVAEVPIYAAVPLTGTDYLAHAVTPRSDGLPHPECAFEIFTFPPLGAAPDTLIRPTGEVINLLDIAELKADPLFTASVADSPNRGRNIDPDMSTLFTRPSTNDTMHATTVSYTFHIDQSYY